LGGRIYAEEKTVDPFDSLCSADCRICGSFLPLPKASAAALIYDDFETGLNGWGPRGPETVELTTEEAYSGRYSLKVSGRTSTWNGPMVDKTDVLTLGESYKLSVYVKFVGDSIQ